MRRVLFAILLILMLASVAPGQPVTGPLAADQLKLFKANRELLEELVSHTVDLANASTPVERVRACHAATHDLSRALNSAVAIDDAERVAEIGDYLNTMLSTSLLPTIDTARGIIPAGTQAERELVELTTQAARDTTRWEQSIPAAGKIGTSVKVQAAREKLQNLRIQLQQRSP